LERRCVIGSFAAKLQLSGIGDIPPRGTDIVPQLLHRFCGDDHTCHEKAWAMPRHGDQIEANDHSALKLTINLLPDDPRRGVIVENTHFFT
jgi:hypothetical protein